MKQIKCTAETLRVTV